MEQTDSNRERDASMSAAAAQALELQRLVETTGDFEGLTPIENLLKATPEFERLTAELAGGIREQRWSVIIADDVSGRIPGLVVGGVARKWSEESSVPKPKLLFVAGGRSSAVNESLGDDEYYRIQDERVDNVGTYLKQNRDAIGKRALFVTDIDVTGTSLHKMTSGLRGAGIPFDVAVLTEDGSGKQEYYANDPAYADVQWYGGGAERWSETPLYAKRSLKPALRDAIGVEKYGAHPTSSATRANNEAVGELRREINALIDRLYEQTFTSKRE